MTRVAWLLAGSGFCALVYQTVWMRLFRLLFGASTAATAATLAVFMAGLGLGGWWLSRRVEAHKRPLELYSQLELAISVLALLSLGAMKAATWLYHATGGSQALGTLGATALRLLLAVMVMGPTVVLMGATLPAAARAVTKEKHESRGPVAVLLGANTLGAFIGVLATTFLLLEMLGSQMTFLVAVLVNVLVSLFARVAARLPTSKEELNPSMVRHFDETIVVPPTPRGQVAFVLLAAACVGAAFMLMELVWYRMLGPILGGSTYTFGVVLAVALVGMGLGGFAYHVYARRSTPTLMTLAMTCAVEALLLLAPFAWGDTLALVSLLFRHLGAMGFAWMVLSWMIITSVVVLPIAVVAGFQFPLLIALLGKGQKHVGREVAWAYAFNTFGSIFGSLVGGFGLIPWLSAPEVWRWTGVALLSLSVLAVLVHVWGKPLLSDFRRFLRLATAVSVAVWAAVQPGPSAAWRHSGIGAGRALPPKSYSPNGVREWVRQIQGQIFAEYEGVESSVALSYGPGIAFYVNGKSDGSALGDAGTQVMGGLLGAALHPEPRNALVVGLGTGSTAGWLAQVPSIEKVDVAEIEPVILKVAYACREVNHGVLGNPKVSVHLEDAREWLMTTQSRYDVVFSEPSNPYRAGIASLYTREFYEAVKARLKEGGVLLQWLQAYEVDSSTVQVVLATLREVFPHVDVWQTMGNDLVLRASTRAPSVEASWLRQRLRQEPYETALRVAWGTQGVEGFLAHFVADDGLVSRIRPSEAFPVNTDDLNTVEFAFAKTVGSSSTFSTTQLLGVAEHYQADRPAWLHGDVNWEDVQVERSAKLAPPSSPVSEDVQRRLKLIQAEGSASDMAQSWMGKPFEAKSCRERLLLAVALADVGSLHARDQIELLPSQFGVERDVVSVRLALSQARLEDAAKHLVEAFQRLRQQVWVAEEVGLEATANAVLRQGVANEAVATRLLAALAEPFPVKRMELFRLKARVQLADALNDSRWCVPAYEANEPHAPWTLVFLQNRVACYRKTESPYLLTAQNELDRFMADGTNFNIWAFEPTTQLPGKQ